MAEVGEFAEAIAAGEEGPRIAQTAGHPYRKVWVCLQPAQLSWRHVYSDPEIRIGLAVDLLQGSPKPTKETLPDWRK